MQLSSDDLPMFFAPAHAALADRLRGAAPAIAGAEATAGDEAARDRAVAAALGAAGLFAHVVPSPGARLDTRGLCLARELLGYVSPRADSILAVQGLATHALGLAGSPDQRAALPAYARGERIGAFALTEPEAGSDVAAIVTRATTSA
jgi:acyl-CoA dehydrogenase